MTDTSGYWWVYWRPDEIHWAHCQGEDPSTWHEGRSIDWETLPVPSGSRVVLCVPGEYVRIHPVNIPTRNRRHFLAGLPYVLEDRLLHSWEEYHYVIFPREGGSTQTPVAVVERRHMDMWLDTATRFGWRLKAVIPEYMLLPSSDRDSLYLDASALPLLLRTPDGGAVIPGAISDAVPGGLLLALENAHNSLRSIVIRTCGESLHHYIDCWRPRLARLGIELENVPDPMPRFKWLARRPTPGKKHNLLSGTYAPKDDINLWIRRLTPAVVLAFATLFLMTAQWFIDGARLQTEEQRLQQSIEKIYRSVFPEAKNLVDPRYQMEKYLENLIQTRQTSAGKGDLLGLLEQLAPVLSGTSGSELQSFSYDGVDLVLEISVPDFETLSVMQKRLESTVIVNVEDARFENGRVYSRLRVEGAG